MVDKGCSACGSPLYKTEAPVFYTCGHFICGSCSLGATCPIDHSEVIRQDPNVDWAVQQAKQLYAAYTKASDVTEHNIQYTQLIEWLEAYLASTYKTNTCPQCGLACTAEGCFNCSQTAEKVGKADAELSPLAQVTICPKCGNQMSVKCKQCGYIDLFLVKTMAEEARTPEPRSSAGIESAVFQVILWTCNFCQYAYNRETSESCEQCQQTRQNVDAIVSQGPMNASDPAAQKTESAVFQVIYWTCNYCQYTYNRETSWSCEQCQQTKQNLDLAVPIETMNAGDPAAQQTESAVFQVIYWTCNYCQYTCNREASGSCEQCHQPRQNVDGLVSQGPMNAGDLTAPKTESAVPQVILWTCNSCQYPYNSETSCEKCQQPRQNVDGLVSQGPMNAGDLTAPKTDTNAELLICSSCKFPNNTWETTCKRCNSLLGPPKWTCPNCKYKFNTQKLVACAYCTAKRPTFTSKS